MAVDSQAKEQGFVRFRDNLTWTTTNAAEKILSCLDALDSLIISLPPPQSCGSNSCSPRFE
jgi:hypothetical protein